MFRIATLCLVALCLALPAQAQLSRKEFSVAYVNALKARFPTASIEEVAEFQMAVQLPDSERITVNLDNAYATYTNDEGNLDSILKRYSESLAETFSDDSAQLSVKDVVPVVKDEPWLTDMVATGEEAGSRAAPDFFYRNLAEGLIVVYAIDTPTSIKYVATSVFTDAGIDLTTIEEQAFDNLRERLPDVELHGSDGLYLVTAGGDFEASLLLMDSLWNKENFPVQGDIVIAIPARDTLLVSGTHNVKQLQKLRELSQEFYDESAYRLSVDTYVRRENSWQLMRTP